MNALESRVRAFLATRSDSMDLDSVPQLVTSDRADFLLSDDKIVCELKAIREDTTKKIPRLLQEYGIHPSNGRYDLSSVLAGEPSAREIERKVWHTICSALETNVRKANQQIREEKKRRWSSATGLLVLINDKVPDLHPELLMHGIGQKLRKIAGNIPRFQHVNMVWIISEVFPPEYGAMVSFLALAPNPLVPISSSALARIRLLNEQWQQESGHVSA